MRRARAESRRRWDTLQRGTLAVAMLAAVAGCGHRAQIAGTIDTTDYVIPAGEVITAIGDVTINASRKIEIDGTLYIASGATVTFKSPSVNIQGSVQNEAMHVGWLRRTEFSLRRLPDEVVARFDRMLGRQPRYWARGRLDCFSPQGRTAAIAASTGKTEAGR